MCCKWIVAGELALILLLSGSAGAIGAAEAIQPVARVEQHYRSFGRGQLPFDAAVAGNSQVVVVGSAGLLVVLERNGTGIASRVQVTSSKNFLSIALAPDGLLRAADDKGTIWHINAALDQVAVEEQTESGSLFGLAYLKDGTGVAVGEFGTILVKEPMVSDWHPLEVDWSAQLPELLAEVGDVAPHIYSVCPIAGDGFIAVGEYGIVVTYRNGLVDFQRVAGNVRNLFSCAVDAFGSEVVGGAGGHLFFRDSPSDTWTRAQSNANSDIYDITVIGADLVAVGLSGAMLTSVDGRHWKTVKDLQIEKTDWLGGVLPIASDLFLFGQNGYVLVNGIVGADRTNLSMPQTH